MADNQPIKGLKKGKFSILSLLGAPDCPAKRVANSLFKKALYAGRFWHCAVMMLTCVSASDTQYRLSLCSSIPLLSVRQHRALNLFQAGCCALAMATGGEAQARERRMATEAGVCPRLTAPTPLSEAKTAGCGGNEVETQDEWSHRERQAECRRCGAISD